MGHMSNNNRYHVFTEHSTFGALPAGPIPEALGALLNLETLGKMWALCVPFFLFRRLVVFRKVPRWVF